MPNATLYVRLSREAGDTNVSLAGMLDDVRALAGRLGYSVYAEHVDDGLSGAIRDRPEFLAWLEDARTGAADAMLTPHADRVTREGVNAAALVLDTIEGKDPSTGKVVREPVRFVDCHGLDSHDEEAFRWRFVIAAEVARGERKRIQKRNIDTRRRLRAAGRWAGGPVPYGAQTAPHPDGGLMLVLNEAEGALLRGAGERLLRGDSKRATVRWLHAQGAVTRRGLPFQKTSLVVALLSDTARSLVFDLATHDALRAALVGPQAADRTGGRPQASLLVGGAAVCVSCRKPITTSNGSYVCRTFASVEPCPGPVSIKIKPVDAWIEAEYLAAFGRLEYLEPRVIITGADDFDASARVLEAAQAALLESPGAESLGAYQAAMERHRTAQDAPRTRERVLMSTGKTIADLWVESAVPERADLLADALAGPIVVKRNPGGRPRGRAPVDPAGRLVVPWRQDEGPDVEM